MASFDKQTRIQATAWINLRAWLPAEGRHKRAQATQLHTCKALQQANINVWLKKIVFPPMNGAQMAWFPFWESWLSSVSWQGLRSVGKATCPNSGNLGFMYFLLWFLEQKSHAEVLHGVCQQECIIHLNPAKTEGFKGFKAKHAGPRFVPCVFSKSWTGECWVQWLVSKDKVEHVEEDAWYWPLTSTLSAYTCTHAKESTRNESKLCESIFFTELSTVTTHFCEESSVLAALVRGKT